MASFDTIAFVGILLVLQFFTASCKTALHTSVNDDDVCKQVDCGQGKCKASPNTIFFYECECDDGWMQTTSENDDHYLNSQPCIVSNCSIGKDCSDLGISKSHKSTSPTPALAESGKGKASSTLQGNHLCLIVLMMSLAIVQWQ